MVSASLVKLPPALSSNKATPELRCGKIGTAALTDSNSFSQIPGKTLSPFDHLLHMLQLHPDTRATKQMTSLMSMKVHR